MLDDNNESGAKTVTIIQSVNNEQILLPELGDLYALQAFFQLHNVDFRINQQMNAEDISQNGELPVVIYENRLISGYMNILEAIKESDKSGDQIKSSTNDKPLFVLFKNIMDESELYYTWLLDDIYNSFTKQHYSYGKPFILGTILCVLKKRSVASKIKNELDIKTELTNILEAINTIFKEKDFEFNELSEFEAFVYGHIKAIRFYKDYYKELNDIISAYPKLIEFQEKIDEFIK